MTTTTTTAAIAATAATVFEGLYIRQHALD